MIITAAPPPLNISDNINNISCEGELQLNIYSENGQIHTVESASIKNLRQHQFTVDRSDEKDRAYTGVLLKELLYSLGVELEGIRQIIARASDGYAAALPIEKVIEVDEVFVVYRINAQPLSTRENTESGAYRMIITNDEYSQRWIEFLTEIELR